MGGRERKREVGIERKSGCCLTMEVLQEPFHALYSQGSSCIGGNGNRHESLIHNMASFLNYSLLPTLLMPLNMAVSNCCYERSVIYDVIVRISGHAPLWYAAVPYCSYYDQYGHNTFDRYYDLCGHINGHTRTFRVARGCSCHAQSANRLTRGQGCHSLNPKNFSTVKPV